MIPARAEAQLFGGFGEELFPFGIGRRDSIENFAISMSVQAQSLDVEFCVTLRLNVTRRCDPSGNLARPRRLRSGRRYDPSADQKFAPDNPVRNLVRENKPKRGH